MNDKFSGKLFSQDKVIAKFENGNMIESNEALLPLFLKKTKDVTSWLQTRAIDSTRVNSRLLKNALKLEHKDDVSTVLSVYGASITDTYWVLPEGKSKTYDDIKFKTDAYSELALNGNMDVFSNKENANFHQTPELTNIGSFEKCWKYDTKNNAWWIVKRGTPEQYFSEIFTYKLGEQLGFYMAEYSLVDDKIYSKDFTSGRMNFEPAASIIGDATTNLKLNYDSFTAISELCGKQYLDILYLDALVRNGDRHEYNYGVLRDIDTGTIKSLAPNFDNNLSLISLGYPNDLKRDKDLLIHDFYEFIEENNINYEVHVLDKEVLMNLCEEIPIDVNKDIIIDFILAGQQVFIDLANENNSKDQYFVEEEEIEM